MPFRLVYLLLMLALSLGVGGCGLGSHLADRIANQRALELPICPAQDKDPNGSEKASERCVSQEASDFHDRITFVADLHADTLMWDRPFLKENKIGHVDYERLKSGNVALQVLTVVTKVPLDFDRDEFDPDGLDLLGLLAFSQNWQLESPRSLKERALYQANRLKGFVNEAGKSNPPKLIWVKSKQDLNKLETLRVDDKSVVGVLLGMEGIHPLGGQLENMDLFYDEGFRLMSPAHLFDNDASRSSTGDRSCLDAPESRESNKDSSNGEMCGLTTFGKKAVQAMFDRGIIVDVAHSSPKAVDEAIEIAKKNGKPVIVSHTGFQELCKRVRPMSHERGKQRHRNLTDQQIRDIADVKGIIGIGLWDEAVCAYPKPAQEGDFTPERLKALIDHAIDVITKHTGDRDRAVKTIALGSDFDGAVKTVFDTTGWRAVTEQLLNDKVDGKRRFSDEEISAIMGGNVLRILKETLPEN